MLLAHRRRLYASLLSLLVLSLALPGVMGQVSAQDATQTLETPDAVDLSDVQPGEVDEEYYELLKLFVDTLDQIDRNYVQDVSRRELMEAAIEGMLSKLDQYSNYIPEEDLDQFRRGVESEFGGIGIHVSVDEADGVLTIISPLVGSPAYRAGLAAGDKILEIEGKPTKGMSVNDAVDQMKGKVGSPVRLVVRHAGTGKTETVTVERAIVRIETVMGYIRDDDDAWSYYLDPEQKIGYIRVTAFSRHTAEELSKALKSLQEKGLAGLVLDLRFNPGGLLSSAIEVSDLFVAEGRIVSTEGRNAPEQVWRAHEEGTFTGFPIAILVNRFSASASEIVAACLKDNERAVIVGERTWGKGSVQNVIELEGGRSALKLTTAGYLRPNGKNIHRFEGASESDDWGVQPDDELKVALNMAQTRDLHDHLRELDLHGRDARERTEDGEEEFVDEQLKKAVEYLEKQLDEPDNEDDDSGRPDDQKKDAGDASDDDKPAEQEAQDAEK